MKIVIMLCFLLGAQFVHANDPDPVAILLASDTIRFPRESFQVDVTIISKSGEGYADESRSLRVLSKGNENSIVLTLEPAIDRGQNILMRGRELWIFMPEVSQAIRLSMSQRLAGQVANGDIARANFSSDYAPTLNRTEEIAGTQYWVLDLVAVDKSVTYSKVTLWVEARTNRPFKSEFYAVSGRLLKTCFYSDYKNILGKLRPTKLTMENPLKKGDVSILTYDSMQLKEIADKVFTKDYMNKM